MNAAYCPCCPFCGRSLEHVRQMIAGGPAMICDICLQAAVAIVAQSRGTPVTRARHTGTAHDTASLDALKAKVDAINVEIPKP